MTQPFLQTGFILLLSCLGHLAVYAWLSDLDLGLIPEKEPEQTVRVFIRPKPVPIGSSPEADFINVIESGHTGSESLADKVAKAFSLPEDVADIPVEIPETIIPDIAIPRQTFVQNPERPNQVHSEFIYLEGKKDVIASQSESVLDKFKKSQDRTHGYMRSGLAALSEYGREVTPAPKVYIPRPNYTENLYESRVEKEAQGQKDGRLTPMLIAQGHIHRHLDRPENQWQEQEFHGVIGFWLDHYGNVRELRFKKRSGNKALDDAIELAIRRASPLPVPSDEIQLRRFIQAPKRFDYNETYLR